MKTSMGYGKLLFARYDGFKIVELEWRLAQNQKHYVHYVVARA